MRVLLLGATGNVGSRLLPALIAHKHSVTAYVRNASKLPSTASALCTAVVEGSGSDSAAIKAAILAHDCDAVVNAAGLANMFAYKGPGELPAIFAAVVKGVEEAQRERGVGAPPIRAWLMSGFSALDAPTRPYLLVDYIPVYPIHKPNYALIRDAPPSEIAWSLFCASDMKPQHDPVNYTPQAGTSAASLVAKADAPPEWSDTLRWVPLLGGYLNVMAQASAYFAPLEECVDFIAMDLTKGLESEFVGKRVGVKLRAK